MTRRRRGRVGSGRGDNVPHLLDEQRVVGDLEGFHDMCNPKVRQMRPTVEALTPACSAILRVLQWVRPFGLLSNVVTRIDSTSASDRVRGAPGLGSSYSASTRPTLNRCRHLPTVTFEQRSFAATATFDAPAPQDDPCPQGHVPIRSGAPGEPLKFYALRR